MSQPFVVAERFAGTLSRDVLRETDCVKDVLPARQALPRWRETRGGLAALCLEPDPDADAHPTAEAAASHTHADAGARRVIAWAVRWIAVTVRRSSHASRDGSR